MTHPHQIAQGPETDQMDRRLIMVELPPAQAGIAAALRRAFQAGSAPVDPWERELDSLLSRLN